MGLDLRWPIGLMFSIIGALLTIMGFINSSNAEAKAPSLGINIDLWWGILLLVFGVVMLLMAMRAGKIAPTQPPGPEEPKQ